jgi:hypothetical protein
MAFCTFQTTTALAVGSVVKADGSSVVLILVVVSLKRH